MIFAFINTYRVMYLKICKFKVAIKIHCLFYIFYLFGFAGNVSVSFQSFQH